MRRRRRRVQIVGRINRLQAAPNDALSSSPKISTEFFMNYLQIAKNFPQGRRWPVVKL
jgi:hypothetical protein